MRNHEIDETRRFRLMGAWRGWREAQAEMELARDSLQREIESALATGVRKADMAHLFGVSRQAIDEYLRWGRRKR